MVKKGASELNHRSRKILSAVISEYLQTGDAVGSRTITRRHGIDLSPATVRNVMADLEELGMLTQPHTSAGRVPTAEGLRFFIDSLLKVRSLSPKEKDEIRERSGVETLALDLALERTSRALSEITRYAGVVIAPAPERRRLRQIEFVPLAGGGRFLCVLVTTEGLIENKLVQSDIELDPGQLERMHNYLNALLEGLTLEEMRKRVLLELGEEKNRYDKMVAAALILGKAAVEAESAASTERVIVSGGANLLRAARPGDGAELERMHDLLRALEEKQLVLDLLDRALASDRMHVFLGAETEYASLADTAIVAVQYGGEDRPLGAIGVIGPTRMNYGRVMSVVDFTAELVTRMLGEES